MAKRKGSQQTVMDEVKDDFIAEIDDAATNYYEAVQERLPKTKVERETKQSLIDTMREHKKKRYVTKDGITVVCTHKDQVKCKPKKAKEVNV